MATARVVTVLTAIVPTVIARKAIVPTATGPVRLTTIPAAMAVVIMPIVRTAIILRGIARKETVPMVTAREAIMRTGTGHTATVRKATARRARVPSGRTGVSVAAAAVVAAEAAPPR